MRMSLHRHTSIPQITCVAGTFIDLAIGRVLEIGHSGPRFCPCCPRTGVFHQGRHFSRLGERLSAAYPLVFARLFPRHSPRKWLIEDTLRGMSSAKVPITLHPGRRSRRPHLQSWRDVWRSLRSLLPFSPRWLFLLPGLVLAVAGASLVGALSFGPPFVGSASLNIGT